MTVNSLIETQLLEVKKNTVHSPKVHPWQRHHAVCEYEKRIVGVDEYLQLRGDLYIRFSNKTTLSA